MVRLIITAIYVFLAVIVCLPYHLYLWVLSKKDKYKSWYKSWRLVRGFFKSVLWLAGTKIEASGLEHLSEVPDDKGILFIGNHPKILTEGEQAYAISNFERNVCQSL